MDVKVKPPLGVEPRWSWDVRMREERINNLHAIHRYKAAGVPVPQEWVDEFCELWDILCPELKGQHDKSLTPNAEVLS